MQQQEFEQESRRQAGQNGDQYLFESNPPYTVRTANDDPREQTAGQEATAIPAYEGYRAQDESGRQSTPGGEKIRPRPRQRRRNAKGLVIVCFIALLLIVVAWLTSQLLWYLVAVLLVAAALLYLFMPHTNAVSSTETRTFTILEHSKLLLNNIDGNVQVQTSTEPVVVLRARKRVSGVNATLKDIELSYTQRGDVISLNARHRRRLFLGKRRLNLVVTVPRFSDVEIKTGSGGIEIAGDYGQIQTKTGHGTLRVHHAQGELHAKTGHGHIVLDHVDGRINVATGAGPVDVSDLVGQVEIRTGSGPVTVKNSRIDREMQISTGSGPIAFEGSLVANGRYQCKTGAGPIDVT